MSSTTIRISVELRDDLRELALQTGLSMQAVLQQAVETYRRQQELAAVNAAYATLRQNTTAWADLEQERGEWDATLADGLEDG